MVLSFFAKMLILQVIVFSIIIFFLKLILDKKLIQLAIGEMRIWQQDCRKFQGDQVIVISHKELPLKYKEKIQGISSDYFGERLKPVFEVDKNIMGGLIIKVGDQTIECSLKDRLNQAFPR